jgi:myo-inositol 2-dehydrogenase/D-chiro-inositol 1-dehydrogenase
MQEFIEVAKGNAASPCTATDALEALRIALACDLSRREHRPVRVEAIK